MKQVIYGMINVFLLILFIILLLIIGENGLRDMEVKMNLTNAMETTMKDIVEEAGNTDYGREEWTADFIESMLLQASDNESLCINIDEVDAEKGILSASVKENFIYANGNQTSKTASRTAILDRVDEVTRETYSISFYCDFYENGEMTSVPFCTLILNEGEKCLYPSFPELGGYVFSYAAYEDGSAVLTKIEEGKKFIIDMNGEIMSIHKNIEIHGVYKIA